MNKKQQVVLIHGGETFQKYEDFIKELESWSYRPDSFTKKRWKNELQNNLGSDYEVFSPTMPNKYNAKYREWKIWFEKVLEHIENETIFIGVSLGGTFLLKYFSEEKYDKKIKALLLVAAAISPSCKGYHLDTFVLDFEKVKKIENENIFIFHSKDDFVVPFSDAKVLKNLLPKSELIIFENRGHFLQEEFPEIVEEIKKLK